MGLTGRPDGYDVEFRVRDDGKILTLAKGIAGAKPKKRKTQTTNRTLAKQQEAILKTDLMKGLINSEKVAASMTFRAWGEKYLDMPEVKNLRSYRDRVDKVRLHLIPFFSDHLLTDLTADDVDDYRAKRTLQNGKAPPLCPPSMGTRLFSNICSTWR
ncbi:MAG: hypothetical protein EWM72_00096 [Nitrospira sp.]|nr:MAG: hypothetical protein EWM72_00096 [Nitrospira sp.]